MSNCPGCDSSSNTYSRCNPPVSSNCVFYQGDSATCEHDINFKICKGNSLSDVQLDLFTEICNLKGSLVVSDIQFLCSDSWKDRYSNEKTVHNLLEDVTTLQCQYVGFVDVLNNLVKDQTTTINGKNAIDPYVSVCLTCCGDTKCNDSSNLHLSEALNKITKCICNLSGTVTNVQTSSTSTLNQVKTLESTVSALQYENCQLKARVTAIETTLEALFNIEPIKSSGVKITPPDYKGCLPFVSAVKAF